MKDSKTSYFHFCLGLLAYHFLLAHGCTYLVSVIACVDCNGVFLLQSICKKMALAPVSTSTLSSLPSSLVVGSISLRFSSVLVARWPTCAAVLCSFLDAIVALLQS